MSDRRQAEWAAFTIGFAAKSGEVVEQDIETMTTLAEQVLKDGDPLRHAIFSFATAYELVDRGAAGKPRLAQLGTELLAALPPADPPAPAAPDRPDLWADRKDING